MVASDQFISKSEQRGFINVGGEDYELPLLFAGLGGVRCRACWEMEVRKLPRQRGVSLRVEFSEERFLADSG